MKFKVKEYQLYAHETSKDECIYVVGIPLRRVSTPPSLPPRPTSLHFFAVLQHVFNILLHPTVLSPRVEDHKIEDF